MEFPLRKFILFAALLALLAVPAIAVAHGKHAGARATAKPAVTACQAERAADPAAFKAKYANKQGHRAMQRCVTRHVRQASKACRAERKADPAAFKTKYANAKGRNAFQRCVHQHSGDPVA